MAARRIVTTVCLVALTLSVAAAAQDPRADAPAAALDSIDRSLKEIVELLRVQVRNQRAELAVQRLDIASRELVARERELHAAEAKRAANARRQEELTARLEATSGARPEESGMSDVDYEFMLRQMEQQAEAVKQTVWQTDQLIIDLRKAIARVREDELAWQKIVADLFADE